MMRTLDYKEDGSSLGDTVVVTADMRQQITRVVVTVVSLVDNTNSND